MLNEHYILGELPSSKLMKMKWNPVTGETMNEEELQAMHEAFADMQSEFNIVHLVDTIQSR